ncbi:response regulator [Candidatus Bipolaricaulota bacterium]|nr:response regulator [Candidatus Bipolaricaulota bacterium]
MDTQPAKRILVADDDADIVGLVSRIIQLMGYESLSARDGEEALQLFPAHKPDLLILDVMMPKKDGWEVLQAIRTESDVPVIMLTVLGSTDDRVKGFSYGADDYIVKPFDNRVVKARIEAVMRRYRLSGTAPESSESPRSITAGVVEIDDLKKEIRICGKRCRLTHKEYELMMLLASTSDKVFSPEEIIEHLWSSDSYMTAADVHQRIYLLRKKVEEDPRDPKVILTVRGFGYRVSNYLPMEGEAALSQK